MSAIPSADSLVVYWILFSIGSAVVCLFALVWAVRTGQFNEPERCARLPLEGVGSGSDRHIVSENAAGEIDVVPMD